MDQGVHIARNGVLKLRGRLNIIVLLWSNMMGDSGELLLGKMVLVCYIHCAHPYCQVMKLLLSQVFVFATECQAG